MGENREAQSQTQKQYVSDNSSYIDQSSLSLRLDTSREIIEFEYFLKGYEITHINPETGAIHYNQTCEPICNNQGIRTLKSVYSGVLSQHMAQGNIDTEMLNDCLRRLNTRLADILFTNRPYWNIPIPSMHLIRHRIMIQAEIFWTRAINDGERNSFTGWKIQSNDVKAETKRGISLWGGK